MQEVSLQRGAQLGSFRKKARPAATKPFSNWPWQFSQTSSKSRALRENPDESSDEHHEAIGRYVELDGYILEAKAKRILAGLAFREGDFNRPARSMSGGWIMRAHLARLLVMEPDLLMLDEPTNHLDLESLGWFQNYLKAYPGAILAISHDRAFLNASAGILSKSLASASSDTPATTTIFFRKNAPERNTTSPPIRISNARSRTSRSSSTASGPRQARRLKLRNVSNVWKRWIASKHRKAGRRLSNSSFLNQCVPAEGDETGARATSLRRSYRLRGSQPHDRARPAHRPGRPERGRQIDPPENPRRACSRPGG